MDDRDGLENRCGLYGHRGFESHPLRHSGQEFPLPALIIHRPLRPCGHTIFLSPADIRAHVRRWQREVAAFVEVVYNPPHDGPEVGRALPLGL